LSRPLVSPFYAAGCCRVSAVKSVSWCVPSRRSCSRGCGGASRTAISSPATWCWIERVHAMVVAVVMTALQLASGTVHHRKCFSSTWAEPLFWT
jgi:hypothetical protein